MRTQLLFFAVCLLFSSLACAQAPPTEMYDLVKKLLCDSSGYENTGYWAVGEPKRYPVAWKADQLEMSEDTSINFFRPGKANITINGKPVMAEGKPMTWSIMLKGPRMGYTSFSIVCTPTAGLNPKPTIDSIFGKKKFTAKLLKSCETNPVTGYYYYEVKLPKKDLAYMKFSWITVNGKTAYRVDSYDSWSKYAVKLDCK